MRSLHIALLALLLTTASAQPAPDSTAPVFAALKDHDNKTLKSLLAHGASPTACDPYGHGPINIAAQNGDIDAIQILLAAGAGIDNADNFGTPLHYAAMFDRFDTATFLLDRGAQVDYVNRSQQTPLIWVVRAHRTQMAALLLAHGANPNLVDRTKVPLLTVASLANDHEIVQLPQKAGVHYASAQEEMMAAASYGDAVRIRQLLAAGTPADLAGASYARLNEGETPLMAAAENGHTEAVRALLAAGARVSMTDSVHRSALFYALKSAHRSTIDALLDAGADPLVKEAGGLTTLMQLATYMDDADLASRFIAAGVDPKAGTDHGIGHTALMQAATMDRPLMLKVLIDAGADVNARTGTDGETALIQAARSGRADCVTLLLRAGADPTVRDRRKDSAKNARDWALEFHHPDIAALLPTN
jgi:ankyrin repeat protein